MSLYVLDTDIFSLWRTAHPIVSQRVSSCPHTDLAITIITVEEQLSGWSAQLRRVRKIDDLARVYQQFTESVSKLAGLPILSFTEPAILRYQHLKTLRLNIGGYDLRIAAITLEQGGILVSRNLRDFQRVPNLVAEDWSV
jgi:tRNA(fMet)-specific endonuclease VapC